MVPFLRDADSTVHSTSRCSGSMPRRRPRTPNACRWAARPTPASGLVGGTDRLPRSRRLGVLLVAPLRQGSGVSSTTHRSSCRAAAGPHRGLGAFVMDGTRRGVLMTTAMLDLASRGLLSFREDKVCSGCRTRSASTRHRRRGCRRGAQRCAERPQADRAGRGLRRSRGDSWATTRRLHRARQAA
jgi:hypothetical protein